MHDYRTTHSDKVEVEMGDAARWKDQDITLAKFQDQTSLVQHEFSTFVRTKGYYNTDAVVVSVDVCISADIDVEDESRKRISGGTSIQGENLTEDA